MAKRKHKPADLRILVITAASPEDEQQIIQWARDNKVRAVLQASLPAYESTIGNRQIAQSIIQWLDLQGGQPVPMFAEAEARANRFLGMSDVELDQLVKKKGLKDKKVLIEFCREYLWQIGEARRFITEGNAQWAAYHGYLAGKCYEVINHLLGERYLKAAYTSIESGRAAGRSPIREEAKQQKAAECRRLFDVEMERGCGKETAIRRAAQKIGLGERQFRRYLRQAPPAGD